MVGGERGTDARPPRDALGSLWTYERRQLQAAIADRGRLLADLYGRAIDSLSGQPITAVALVIAGHCIRDVVNGLSDALTEAGVIPKYESIDKPAKALADAWEKHKDVLDPITVPVDGADEPAPETPTPVPRALVLTAGSVAEASRKATGNARRRYAALILGRVEAEGEEDPTVTLFKKSVGAFEKKRHPGRDREVSVDYDTLAELEQALRMIESVLEGRLGSFFEALEDVVDILDAANRREGLDIND